MKELSDRTRAEMHSGAQRVKSSKARAKADAWVIAQRDAELEAQLAFDFEPVESYPSDKLLAQITVVAG